MGKIFKLMVFMFPENALNLAIFTHDSFPTRTFFPSFSNHTLGREKLLIAQAAFSKRLSHSTTENG